MKIHSESPQFDKWLAGVSSQDPVLEAVGYSLRSRLASVQRSFPRAVILEVPGAEEVHQLRVAMRRSLAALELYREILPTKPAKSLHRTLKKILRAAGAARDLDVLTERYRQHQNADSKRLVGALQKRRSKAQLRLMLLYIRLRREDRLINRIEKLLTSLKSSDLSDESLGNWMKPRWSRLVAKFSESVNFDSQDLDALHRFRILGKELRYAIELLAPTFDRNSLEEAYQVVEQLQLRLGNIHDHAVARKMFSEWIVKRNRVSKACNLNRLGDGEYEMLQRELRDFVAWWTPALKTAICAKLAQLAILDPHGR